jgi:hypothetical protein
VPSKTYPTGPQTAPPLKPVADPSLLANRKQVPTMGRIVFYTQPGGHDGSGKIKSLDVIPAMTQSTNSDGTLNLWLYGDVQVSKKNRVPAGGPNGDVPAAGCWHWPPRV